MKKLTALLTGLIFFLIVNAQVAGPNAASGVSTVAIPGSDINMGWVNIANVAASDNAYASFGNLSAVPVGGYSDYLVATDFGFSLPAGAIIEGIILEAERSDNSFKAGDYSVKIVKNGVICGSEKSTGQSFPFSDSYHSFGNTTDLWGQTWTDADINASGFGVAISARRNSTGGTSNGRVDHIRIFVFYSLTTLSTNFFSLYGTPRDKIVQLTWTTTGEINMKDYEVERSDDGTNYKNIATVQSKNNFALTTYSVNDENPVSGTAFYRIRSVENTGLVKYSKTIAVHFVSKKTVQVYPNPWAKGTSLYINNYAQENLQVLFYDCLGKLVGTGFAAGTSNVNNIIFSAYKGMLFYKVINSNNDFRGSGKMIVTD